MQKTQQSILCLDNLFGFLVANAGDYFGEVGKWSLL